MRNLEEAKFAKDNMWLKMCQLSPEKYEVTVDNDSISARQLPDCDCDDGCEKCEDFEGEYYSFSTWGEEFIVNLLRWCGIKAERC